MIELTDRITGILQGLRDMRNQNCYWILKFCV